MVTASAKDKISAAGEGLTLMHRKSDSDAPWQGRLPFQAGNHGAVIKKIIMGEYTP